MEFDFDGLKSTLNKVKHGIDFLDGQAIWNDPNAIVDIPDSHKNGEDYFLAIGETAGKIWAVIYNMRVEMIHIVSIRPARDYERTEYEILKD